jgi:NADPH2:quinone reductase
MRAALCRHHGGPQLVELAEVDSPKVGPGQVAVAVHTAAVNFPDVLIVANDYQIKVPPPFVPGSEFAGRVTEVGAGVDQLQLGDRVFGASLAGAFAEQIVVDPTSVTPVPVGVDLDVAAGFGVAHRTAYHVLRSVARLDAGEELVVLGAGGGVGLAAVQLGCQLGATVTAVASSAEKLAAATALGASRGINHRETDLRAALREALPDGAHVVVDPVGGALTEPALRGLRRGGRFVTVGYASGEIPRVPLNLVLLKNAAILGFEIRTWGLEHPEQLARNEAELLGLLASGKAAPYIGARFGLADVRAALEHVAAGKAVGKVLLDITRS